MVALFLTGGVLSGIGLVGWFAGSNVWAPRIGLVGATLALPAMLALAIGG